MRERLFPASASMKGFNDRLLERPPVRRSTRAPDKRAPASAARAGRSSSAAITPTSRTSCTPGRRAGWTTTRMSIHPTSRHPTPPTPTGSGTRGSHASRPAPSSGGPDASGCRGASAAGPCEDGQRLRLKPDITERHAQKRPSQSPAAGRPGYHTVGPKALAHAVKLKPSRGEDSPSLQK